MPNPLWSRYSSHVVKLAVVIAFAATTALAQVRDYNRIVVFGDSLSDTGNVAHLTFAKYGVPVPSPIGGNYTLGRFTDGYDTVPAAQNYFGVWLEQLSTSIKTNSIDNAKRIWWDIRPHPFFSTLEVRICDY